MPTEPGRRRLAWRLAAGVLLALLAWLLTPRANDVKPAPSAPSAAPAGLQLFGALPLAEAPPADKRSQLLEQVRRFDHTYCSYLQNTRYPHESRPASHSPDQMQPNLPVLESHPMRLDGGGSNTEVTLQTAQSRVYLAAGESVSFSLRAQDSRGHGAPLLVTRALAQGLTYDARRSTPRMTLDFLADGAGAWHAGLTPAHGALAQFHGTIRTTVGYRAGGKDGVVLFDVLVSPVLPARWSGKAAEVEANGSLDYVLGLDVDQPGRYVVTGRIDDARGQPFALASFNDVLGAGAQQVRLPVFGKLLHDGAPQLPLVLRDVEGYLLREDADPDRLLLPRLEGRVASGQVRSLDGIANTEWQSEERSRYLAEYAKDLRQARTRLQQLDPAQALPASACAPPGR